MTTESNSSATINCRWLTNKEFAGCYIILLFFAFASVYNGNIYYNNQLLISNYSSNIVSYCSEKADLRGPHQNVIAYSLYGNFSDPKVIERYVEPFKLILSNISRVLSPGKFSTFLIASIKLLNRLLNNSDWEVRIYYSTLDDDGHLTNLLTGYPFVDLCNVTRITQSMNISRPLFPMTWRFLPLLDRNVDRLLSRDTDSHIFSREVDAVQQWLTESNATFHLMRDHSMHCVEILGGNLMQWISYLPPAIIMFSVPFLQDYGVLKSTRNVPQSVKLQ